MFWLVFNFLEWVVVPRGMLGAELAFASLGISARTEDAH